MDVEASEVLENATSFVGDIWTIFDSFILKPVRKLWVSK